MGITSGGYTMSKKWTHDMFVDFVRKETTNFKVLGNYVNNETKILMYHQDCGREFLIRPADFKRRKRCSPCNINKKKNTFEYKTQVKNLSNDEYEILEEYVNDHTKLMTKHKLCGYEWKASPTHFIQGKRCPKCAGNLKKTTQQFFKEVEQLTGKEYSVLSEYEHSHSKVMIRHNCEKCDNYEFPMSPTDFLSGKRCPECKIINQSGERHWKYNPNLTKEERGKRDMFNGELRKWRETIFKRDNYICQICNNHSHKLNAHHLYSWNAYKEKRFSAENGVTLFSECHKKFHSKFGYGNNTKEQFELFKASL